jgi:hypothetical protein
MYELVKKRDRNIKRRAIQTNRGRKETSTQGSPK